MSDSPEMLPSADGEAPSGATPLTICAPSDQPPLAAREAALPSLPPAVQGADTTPPTSTTSIAMVKQTPSGKKKKKPDWKIAKDSVVRKKALAIVAMRANGYTTEQISKELGITPSSVKTYVYRAVKSGFLVDKKKRDLMVDPHDQIEFKLAGLAVDNLEEMLTNDRILSKGEKSVKLEATLAVANGVLFKRYDVPKETSMPTNILQINIQGHQDTLVDVSAGGAPLYVDGETLDDGSKF